MNIANIIDYNILIVFDKGFKKFNLTNYLKYSNTNNYYNPFNPFNLFSGNINTPINYVNFESYKKKSKLRKKELNRLNSMYYNLVILLASRYTLASISSFLIQIFTKLNSIYTTRYLTVFMLQLKELHIRFVGSAFYYFQGLLFLLFVDACLTDDEPL